MQSDTYIPRRLDDQWKLGFWDADVAFPFVFALFVGYLCWRRPKTEPLLRVVPTQN